MNGDNYRNGDYHQETFVADGPWEAKFIFCGKYGVNPKDVSVSPSNFRHPNYEYQCSVGKLEPGRFYLNDWRRFAR